MRKAIATGEGEGFEMDADRPRRCPGCHRHECQCSDFGGCYQGCSESCGYPADEDGPYFFDEDDHG